MAAIKCKMCGGDLELNEGITIAECEYCGTKQTVPNADNEKKLAMFERANRLRMANEFDKAAGIYENIIADFSQEAEAYWGVVLCKFGIEYVDDPASGKKVPTCHRSSFDSIFEDSDFEQACENADTVARRIYRDEAKVIEDIRKGIIEVSGKEAPYDIFICYKETDMDGNRTIDSVLAQEVYDALTEKGYRVFFSRITLEDKLGTEYEPYIFAALNSSKIMLAFGTDYENYNAVWVKNEWSRFLKLMAQDKNKYLIPCYKGIDAYDMPKEFTRFQAQDMGKIGAVQDLLRGIEKLLPSKKLRNSETNDNDNDNENSCYAEAEKYLKRGRLHLEDGEWQEAYDCFDEAWRTSESNYQLTIASVGCICAELGIDQIEKFTENTQILSESISHEQALCLTELKAGQFGLELSNWELADKHFDKAIEQEPECADAYIGKMLAQYKMIDLEHFAENVSSDYINNGSYKKAIRFANSQLKEKLEQVERQILEKERKIQEEAAERARKNQAEVEKWEAYRKKWLEKTEPLRGMIVADFEFTACVRSDGIVLSTKEVFGSKRVSEWVYIETIAGHYNDLSGVRYDGYLLSSHERGDLLEGVIALDNLGDCCIRKDGTVKALYYEGTETSSLSQWSEIASVAQGGLIYGHMIGLRKDGTVISRGHSGQGQCAVSSWRDITSVFVSKWHTVGLRSDGTVVAVGRTREGQCRVFSWTYIVDIAVTDEFTVGLRLDGTVVCTLDDNHLQEVLSSWRNIAAIAVNKEVIIGVRYDGTVIGTRSGKYDISSWTNIVAVAASNHHIVGIRADGTVVATGDNDNGQCNVFNWKLFKSLDTLPMEKEAYRKVQEPWQSLFLQKYKLCKERASLGVFAVKQKKELDNRIAILTAEIRKLQANSMK